MKPKRAALPVRVWYGPDKLRAAWMAGNGASAAEIAKAIGGTTAQRVRAMLNEYRIPLIRRCRGEDVLTVVWRQDDRRRLNSAAAALDFEPAELAALVLRAALAGGTDGIAKLIDGVDVG